MLCFTLYFEGNFQEQVSGAGLYLEGRFNGGCFGLRVWGFLFGEDYTWRGLFSEFYGRLRAETNCGIAHILGIPADEHLRHIDIFFNNCDNLQPVHFEYHFYLMVRGPQVYDRFISSGHLVSTLGNKVFILSTVCKNFSLNTERKFTKIINDNVKLRRRKSYSAK